MTNKHFAKIAALLNEYSDCAPFLAPKFADWLAQENPRFDRERFLEACGVECENNP